MLFIHKITVFRTVDGKLLNENTPSVIQEKHILKVKVTSKAQGGMYCCHADNGLHIKDKVCGALHVRQGMTIQE